MRLAGGAGGARFVEQIRKLAAEGYETMGERRASGEVDEFSVGCIDPSVEERASR